MFFALSLLLSPASAIPMEFSHQGRLLDAQGTPLSSNQTLVFTIENEAGDVLWTEESTPSIDTGYFSVILGKTTPMDSELFDGQARYLAMSVNGTPMEERSNLVSVPYAVRAQTAHSVDGGLVNGSDLQINGSSILNSEGESALDVDWSKIKGIPDEVALLDGQVCSETEVLTLSATGWSCVEQNTHAHDAAQITGTLHPDRLKFGSGEYEVAHGNHGHDVGALSGTITASQASALSASDVGAVGLSGDSTVVGNLIVQGSIIAETIGGGCAAGYTRLGGGDHGICIQIDPTGEAGCFNDECMHRGMRACSCPEVKIALFSGKINPTTDALNTAGEYCMSGIGHCQGNGAGCSSGATVEISKIWPNYDASAPPSQWYGIASEPSTICDESRPTAHSGGPYGSYRCCY